jgi:hypothetical protein
MLVSEALLMCEVPPFALFRLVRGTRRREGPMNESGEDEGWTPPANVTYPPRIPRFASEEEAREFFGTHDTSPYVDQMEDVTDNPPATLGTGPGREGSKARKRPPEGRMDLVSLRMPGEMIENVKKVAAQRHLPYQTLMRSWIGERLDEELRALGQRR